MNASNVTKETVTFRPRSRLIETIGGDLIKDEMAGVIELVKNGYDADATLVTIAFNNLDNREKASIAIEDNGHGMTRKTLVEDWMSPATHVKGDIGTSPSGRPMLGRKGVGRFSAMRLGDVLKLETTPSRYAPGASTEELDKRYRLYVDWNDFRVPGRYLEDVALELEVFADSKKSEHWTRLEIRKLTEAWDQNRLSRLVRELRLLLSPIPIKHHTDFSIHFNLLNSKLDPKAIRDFPKVVEPYGIPEIADYTVNATIKDDGSYSLKYRRRLYADSDNEDLEVSERGEDIRKHFEEGSPQFAVPLPCGPIKVQFHIWDRDPDILQRKIERGKYAEEMGVRALRRYLDEVSGVAIYRDQFRVRPYGDATYDWLGLAQRRVQLPVQSIGPNQLFGLVKISSVRNPGLEDKSSREGLKENRAFEALRQCTLSALSWCEPHRYLFRKRHGLGRPAPTSTRAITEERQGLFRKLRERIDDTVTDEKARKQVSTMVSKAEGILEKEHESLAHQIEIMHDMHALGLLARFVIHEGRNLGSSLDSALSIIERIAEKYRQAKQQKIIIINEGVSTFDTSLLSARSAEERIDALLDQLDPLTRPRRRRRQKVAVENVIRKVLSILMPASRDSNIGISVGKGSHEIVAWEADVFHTVYNLLHNSIYWVQQRTGGRKITVQIRRRETKTKDETALVEISVSDNGPGVSSKSAASIFDLGYSEKPAGYGIGLFIAREAIERSGGTIELVNPGERGAEFRVILEGA